MFTWAAIIIIIFFVARSFLVQTITASTAAGAGRALHHGAIIFISDLDACPLQCGRVGSLHFGRLELGHETYLGQFTFDFVVVFRFLRLLFLLLLLLGGGTLAVRMQNLIASGEIEFVQLLKSIQQMELVEIETQQPKGFLDEEVEGKGRRVLLLATVVERIFGRIGRRHEGTIVRPIEAVHLDQRA